jgi:chemosensory pili system protein ChpA (sensor histidine kinase/response regulator)
VVESKSQNNTILVVDDSIHVRRLLADTLEKAGYQVVQAQDGQEALDKLFGGLQVQAVFCDLEMPNVDGYEFLERCRCTAGVGKLPVVMLTSRASDKYRLRALELGASAYFTKPYIESELIQTLEQLLRTST